MFKFSPDLLRSLSLLPLTSVALASGCQFLPKQAAAPTPTAVATPDPKTAGPQPPKIDYARVRPNELGAIPVIMYHEVKGTENKNLTRSVSDFRKDLEVLYKAGFYPVNLSDVVNNNLDVPAGKSPVALTFDDARPSQFRLIETPEALKVDPDCAVGIMEAFSKQHPDWPLRATFFVLPKSKVTVEPFGQVGMGNQKLAYLVEKGMEIGNHSTRHKNMRGMSAAQIQEELGYANNAILEAVPNAKIQVFALPMGKAPTNKKNLPYLLAGEFNGKKYQHQAVFLAAWRPIASPASKEYDPFRLERIDSINGTNGIRDWVKKLTTSNSGYTRYVSDGDPNVVSYPKGNESLVNKAKLDKQGKLAYAYEPFGGAGGAKPIVSAGGSSTIIGSRPIDTTPPGTNRKPIVVEVPSDPTPTPAAVAIEQVPKPKTN